MELFEEAASKIIKEQESIIGPVAIEQAQKVSGLNVDWTNHKVSINGDKSKTLQKLVEQYQGLFGRASVEVCRDAVSDLFSNLSKDQIPALLR